MEDEIADGAFRGLLRLLSMLVRGLVWFAYEIVFETLCWYIGWPICRVLTFGKFPKEGIADHQDASGVAQAIVSMIGFVSLILLGIALSLWE